MSILVIAEHDNSSLKPATLNSVTAAQAIGGDIDILVVGSDCQGAAEQAANGLQDAFPDWWVVATSTCG